MKNGLWLFIGIMILVLGCTEQNMNPVADFAFRDEAESTFAMGTYDTCSVVNRSLNAKSIHWDLGDGRTSTDERVILSYDKSGTYHVRLTVTGSDGEESTISKSIVVKDRVLRSINISQIYWKLAENGWPPTAKAEVYLQIQKYTESEMTEGYLCDSCPVIFTSNSVKDIANLTTSPFSIPVNEKIILDKKMIKFAHPENLNDAYLISLMAKDKDGNAYCLQSNRGGGSTFGVIEENFAKNKFIIENGPFSNYTLVCDFE